MPNADFWLKIAQYLDYKRKICLLWVVASEGSSPGREGFGMAVAESGESWGTIGGGIMEHKLVELAKSRFAKNENDTLYIEQHHDKSHARQQSGMICSGEQTVVLLHLKAEDKRNIERFAAAVEFGARQTFLQLSPLGISLDIQLEYPRRQREAATLTYQSPQDWFYTCSANRRERLHIIGGGHTSLALSEVMQFLGFELLIYDDRANLNTMEQNNFGICKKVINYEQLAAVVQPAPADFVAIMTVGYRTDKLALMQLLPFPVRYLGLLGSKAKIQTMHDEFIASGGAPDDWARIHTPIGLDIKSETVQEIAISIAAQIIAVKNLR
jgi:xanthine dehydrogenase accessory factor